MTSVVVNPAASCGPVSRPGDPGQAHPASAAAAPATLWLRALIQESGKAGADGLPGAGSAPALDEPTMDFSGDSLALVLSSLDSKCKEAQARTAMTGIEVTHKQRDAASAARIEKLKEALQRASEAQSAAKCGKVWGWLGKVAAFIGAMVAVVAATAATVATGGTAAPLLVMALLGAAAATVDLASQINQEVHPDAKPFTLGSLIGDAIIKAMDDAGLHGKGRAALAGMASALGFLLMQPDLAGQMAEDSALADGASKEAAARIRMGVAIAAVVTTLIAMIAITVASGGAGGGQLAGEASQMVNAAHKLSRAAQYVQAATSVVAGTAAIGGGVAAIGVAKDKEAADHARASAKELEALLLKLQKMAEEQTERLKEVMAAMEESWRMFSSMIAAGCDQRTRIARNLVQA